MSYEVTSTCVLLCRPYAESVGVGLLVYFGLSDIYPVLGRCLGSAQGCICDFQYLYICRSLYINTAIGKYLDEILLDTQGEFEGALPLEIRTIVRDT